MGGLFEFGAVQDVGLDTLGLSSVGGLLLLEVADLTFASLDCLFVFAPQMLSGVAVLEGLGKDKAYENLFARRRHMH